MDIFNIEIITNFLRTNLVTFSIVIFLGAFICVNLLIPVVIWVAYQKRLTTPVIARSSHSSRTPAFGGVAFFMTIIVFISFIQIILNDAIGYNIIAAISILFMVGLKDDLVNSTARVKLIGQLLACLFIVLSPEFWITSCHGFLHIYEVNPILSLLFSIFFMTFIINAYNLIDGIDGLAAMAGIIICGVYAYLFYIKNDAFFFLISVTTVAILVAFLRFNLATNKMKMFMGDCGSLIIGLIIGFLTLHFLVSKPTPSFQVDYFFIENRILFITAVLFIPLFDTIRIIIIRIINGKSPFEADRNHMHHILIDSGLSHLRATLTLGAINLFVLFIFFLLSRTLNSVFMSGFMAVIYILIAYFFFRLSVKNRMRLNNI